MLFRSKRNNSQSEVKIFHKILNKTHAQIEQEEVRNRSESSLSFKKIQSKKGKDVSNFNRIKLKTIQSAIP